MASEAIEAVTASSIAVKDALGAWQNAPVHFRVMGSAVVGPILAAVIAQQRALEKLAEGGEK